MQHPVEGRLENRVVAERGFGESAYVVEGSVNKVAIPMENASIARTASLIIGFSTADFLCLYFYMDVYAGSTAQTLQVRIKTDDSNYYYTTFSYTESGGAGYHKYEQIKIGSMSTTGSPDLEDITEIEFVVGYTTAIATFYVDDVRIVAADPDDANNPNDTGVVWDFESGTWHVYELTSAVKYLGQIDIEANVEKVALIHTNYGADVQFLVKCRAKRDGGTVGLVFRCTDATSGSEDCYAFLMDTFIDSLLLREYTAGTLTNVALPVSYTLDVDTDYYLGVEVKGSGIECFISTTLANLWGTANRKFNETDATHASGKCGLMSISTLGRFTELDLNSVADRHVPDDQIDVTVEAVFQTVMPFYE